MATVKTSGSFDGKSNKLGYGGRADQLKAQGVPGGVIGELARKAHAAPGQANFHGKKDGGMVKAKEIAKAKDKLPATAGHKATTPIKPMLKCGGEVGERKGKRNGGEVFSTGGEVCHSAINAMHQAHKAKAGK